MTTPRKPSVVLLCLIVPMIALAGVTVGCAVDRQKEEQAVNPEIEMPGAHREYDMEGYSDEITSREIVSFRYRNGSFSVSCEKNGDGSLRITSSGGNSRQRDGTAFGLNYTAGDDGFTGRLQELIETYALSRGNGHVTEVGGLPAGIGDTLSVAYESGEKLYKSSNQFRTVADDAGAAIYEAFHEKAVASGFDFTTAGSNVQLYDDADEQYLQGTWKGMHFGTDVAAEFEGNRVKIWYDGELTDDTEYVVFEGDVRPNRLREGVTEPQDAYDYEEFAVVSSFRKKNDIMIVAYFTKDSYSTCELLIDQDA